MNWSTYWDTENGLSGRTWLSPLTELAAALNERTSPPEGTELEVDGRSLSVVYGMSQQLDICKQAYINHTLADENGVFAPTDFDGSGFPRWTRADLETEIGAVYPASTVSATSLVLRKGTLVTADLLSWWQKAINLFVWLDSSRMFTLHPCTLTITGAQRRYLSDVSYNEQAVTSYQDLVDIWVSQGSWLSYQSARRAQVFCSYEYRDAPKWPYGDIRKQRFKWEFGNGLGYNVEADWYISIDDGGYQTFNANEFSGYSPVEGEIFKYQTTGPSDSTMQDDYIINDTPPTQPSGSQPAYRTEGFDVYQYVQVFKMDVPGGFTYQATG